MGARLLLFTVVVGATACRGRAIEVPREPAVLAGPIVEVVETAPVETSLDHADIPDAHDVWLSMIDRARVSLAFAEFYASDVPDSRLSRVIERIEAAADRGVAVRFLVDRSFLSKYPDTLARFGRARGIEVRVLDLDRETGGILHAKYFVVDGREAFVGSQNFDWRALEHIQEIGLALREPQVVGALSRLFDADWKVAGGEPRARGPQAGPWRSQDGALELAASPRGLLPDEDAWDLPRLVARIDRARASILVQVLTYKARTRDGTSFTVLDDALRRAAARGVSVRLMVSAWGAKDDTLRALATVRNVTVSILTIPRWSGGDIPYARVAHAKYMVVDAEDAWVGTSNWEGDYFLSSRNVSVFVRQPDVCARLARVFEDGWRTYGRPLQGAP